MKLNKSSVLASLLEASLPLSAYTVSKQRGFISYHHYFIKKICSSLVVVYQVVLKHCVGMEPLLLKHAAPVFSGKHADFCVHLSRLGLDHVRNVHEFKLFPITVLNVVDFIIRVGFPLTFNSIQSMLKLFIKSLSGFLTLPTIAYHFKFLLAM